MQWRLEALAYSLVEGIAAAFPGSWVCRCGEALGGLAWHLLPGRRKTVLRNLRIAFHGELDSAAIARLAKASFRRTGSNLFGATRTAALDRDALAKVVEVRGIDHIDEALSQGRGLVVLIPHMGNWEVLSRIHLLMPGDRRMGAFYRPLNNPVMDRRVRKRREADGTRMFSKHDGALQAISFLRENTMLGILADQRVGMAGDIVPFFGRITRASPLPSLLSRRVKCPVLVLSTRTERPGYWTVEFRPVDPPATTAACMDAIETEMRSSPEDYFWLQERWKVYVRPEHPINEWLGATSGRGETPHRALVWLDGAPAGWRPPGAWFHPDVDYEAVLTDDTPLPDWLPPETKRHTPPAGSGKLRAAVSRIDAAGPLPLDFIVAPATLRDLAKAGKREGIPVVLLP
ncbi:MAG: lysophospholipid acyltransferase family protein [Verrucomicrobiae bacterium]|nr:lysophospholipid acyltransferase family protein [Verrucomicrobiae bacterium]MCP5548721.1 lysophospholipid acyltransferase family protein [Akkermansiaceae bacterium]